MPAPPRASLPGAGVRIGTVTALTDLGPLVEVRSLRIGYSYGPARVAETLGVHPTMNSAPDHAHTTPAGRTGAVAVGTDPAHDHGIPSTDSSSAGGHTHTVEPRPLKIGDEVLVAFLADSRTELVVIDRLLPAGAPVGP